MNISALLSQQFKKEPDSLWQLLKVGGITLDATVGDSKSELIASFLPHTAADWNRFLDETLPPFEKAYQQQDGALAELLLRQKAWLYPGVLERVVKAYPKDSKDGFKKKFAVKWGDAWLVEEPASKKEELAVLSEFDLQLLSKGLAASCCSLIQNRLMGAAAGVDAKFEWVITIQPLAEIFLSNAPHAVTPAEAWGALVARALADHLDWRKTPHWIVDGVLGVLVEDVMGPNELAKQQAVQGFFNQLPELDQTKTLEKVVNVLKQDLEPYLLAAQMPEKGTLKSGRGPLKA